jgi:hypothetical protein
MCWAESHVSFRAATVREWSKLTIYTLFDVLHQVLIKPIGLNIFSQFPVSVGP